MSIPAGQEQDRERSDHGDRNLRAWTEVLDRLERDVEATEQLAAAAELPAVLPEPAPWQAPELDGPLPDQLLARARGIHQRQTAAKTALGRAIARSRAQQQSLRPRAAGGSPTPAYLDVSA